MKAMLAVFLLLFASPDAAALKLVPTPSLEGAWELVAADKILPGGEQVHDLSYKVAPRADGSVPVSVWKKLE